MWIVMSDRSKPSYTAVWDFIKTKFPNFKPEKCHCDYETALRKTLKKSFNAKIIG